MRLFKSRRRKVFGGTFATLAVAAIAVGTALAYYGGSGSGNASAAAAQAPRSVDVIVNDGNPVTPAIYPGETVTIPYEITLTGNGRAHIGSVSGSVAPVGGPGNGCLPAWFTLEDDGDFTPGQVSSASPITGNAELTFLDENVLQDACSNVELTLTLTASPN